MPPRGGDEEAAQPSPGKRRGSLIATVLVWIVAAVIAASAIVLLLGSFEDLRVGAGLTVAERTTGAVAWFSALVGIIGVCASAATLVLDAILKSDSANRAATIVLGAALLLLGVSGSLSIAWSIDDPCDSTCVTDGTTPAPVPSKTDKPQT